MSEMQRDGNHAEYERNHGVGPTVSRCRDREEDVVVQQADRLSTELRI